MKKKETTMQITVTRTLKLEEKVCPTCQKRFMGPLVKKYCSRECLNRADYERNAEARRVYRREKYKLTKASVKT
jgi:hypothetical protein